MGCWEEFWRTELVIQMNLRNEMRHQTESCFRFDDRVKRTPEQDCFLPVTNSSPSHMWKIIMLCGLFREWSLKKSPPRTGIHWGFKISISLNHSTTHHLLGENNRFRVTFREWLREWNTHKTVFSRKFQSTNCGGPMMFCGLGKPRRICSRAPPNLICVDEYGR